MRLLLGLGNKARHGKDSAATAIETHFNELRSRASKHGLRPTTPEVKRVAFANALRRESSAAIKKAAGIERLLAHGFRDDKTGDWIDFPSWVTADLNPDMSDPLLPYGKHSKLLQWWGTEYRRKQDQNYWVNQVNKELADFNGIALITDVRFLNERDYVKSQRNGYLINVTRLNSDGTPFVDPTRPADHVSETSLDGINWDASIRTKTGEAALSAELAITIANYFYQLGA
jgi:hypothetical protein